MTIRSWQIPGGAPQLVAEFVQKTAQAAIAPGKLVKYSVDIPAGVVNTIGVILATPTDGIGDAFQLPVGTYMVDWENSADAAWSLGICQGSTKDTCGAGIINNTIAGASTATTWIHGRGFITVTGTGDTWIGITPKTGTQSIPTAGTAAGFLHARITILKLT